MKGYKTKVVAVVNQKGGVGKTTTVANLGYTLAKMGKDVLLIDYDGQASLSNYFNIGLNDNDYYGIYEMMLTQLRDIPEEQDPYLAHATIGQMCEDFIIRPTYTTVVSKTVDGVKTVVEEPVEFGVSLLASCADLDDYALELGENREVNAGFCLSDRIKDILDWHEYDYVLIDCNPTLGILTMNAIIAATDGILIPTNLDVMSTRGVRRLIDRVVEIQEMLRDSAGIDHMGIIGIVLNLYADRRTVDQSLKNDMKHFYPFKIFNSQIPESVNAKKAAMTGVTYSQMYKKAETAYMSLAGEFEEKLAEMEAEGPKIIGLEGSMSVSSVSDEEEN